MTDESLPEGEMEAQTANLRREESGGRRGVYSHGIVLRPGRGGCFGGKGPPLHFIFLAFPVFFGFVVFAGEIFSAAAAETDGARKAGVPLPVVRLDGIPKPGRWVALSGERTRSPAGPVLQQRWRQTAGPRVRLNAADFNSARAWVFMARPGVYRFTFKAKNRRGWSEEEELSFEVPPERPFRPLSEGFRLVGAGELVVFPGEGWRRVRGPKTELRLRRTVKGAETGPWRTELRPVRAGLYLFEAVRAGDVPERRGFLVPPGKSDLVGDRRPSARLPRFYRAAPGCGLILEGAAAWDPDGESRRLAAKWSTSDLVRGVRLTPLAELRASFYASRPGIYHVSLAVSDGFLESRPAEAFVYVKKIPGKTTASPLGPVPVPAPEKAWPPSAAEPLFCRVSLGLYESHLQRAVRLFPSRCGVSLSVEGSDSSPERLRAVPLNCGVVNAPLVHLLDWTARQSGRRWFRAAGREVRLTPPDFWAKREPEKPVVFSATGLFYRKDGADLLGPLRKCFENVLRLRPTARIGFGPARRTITASLPKSAARRLRELGAALHSPRGGATAWASLPLTDAAGEELRRKLATFRLTKEWRDRRLDFLLRDLGELSGTAVGFDPRAVTAGAGRLPYLTLSFHKAPLREVVRTIVATVPFDGCSCEPPAGLWFFRGGRPYPSAELLRETAVVRLYDLRVVLRRIAPLNGEVVAFEVRRRIYPDSWRDPAVGAAYFSTVGKLAVVHGPAAQRKVAEFLRDLLVRGERALGGGG